MARKGILSMASKSDTLELIYFVIHKNGRIECPEKGVAGITLSKTRKGI
jgi:hypothetical protein